MIFSQEINDFNLILKAFKIKAECISLTKNKNSTYYDLNLLLGAKVKDISKYLDEFSLALKTKTKPLLKIVPELGVIRLEIVNPKQEKISFYEEFQKNKTIGDFPMYLGISSDGSDVCMDMAKNPHLLIAGTTGSGKSTLIHTIIANSLITNARIFLVDTKSSDFSDYNFDNFNLSSNYQEACDRLRFIYATMDYRYNEIKNPEHQNNVIFIIDEFADLVAQDISGKFRDGLCKLTQKCRAANIFCILATQRPSVDIISGTIKANFPARITCRVASGYDSRIILNTTGAEKLVGNGDAIIHNYNNNYQRFQIAYSSAKETVNYIQNGKL